MRRVLTAAFVMSGVLLMAGCGGASDAESGEKVSASDVKPWPLTVDEGELKCHGDEEAVTFTVGGTEYALNGAAKSKYKDIAPIWKGSSKIEGTKVPVTKLLERGRKLCG
ncbi:DUF2511 domain-containing protein [Streptomyces cacaoi]